MWLYPLQAKQKLCPANKMKSIKIEWKTKKIEINESLYNILSSAALPVLEFLNQFCIVALLVSLLEYMSGRLQLAIIVLLHLKNMEIRSSQVAFEYRMGEQMITKSRNIAWLLWGEAHEMYNLQFSRCLLQLSMLFDAA